MAFFGCHGVLPEEKSIPQQFVVDLDLHLDLSQAAENDDLALTVDYSQVYLMVKDMVENRSYNLLETLAHNIAQVLLDSFPITAVDATVYKPTAPIRGDFTYFAVKVKKIRK